MIKASEARAGKKYVIINNCRGDYPCDNGRSNVGKVIVADEIGKSEMVVWTRTIHHPDTQRSHWYFSELKEVCFLCGGTEKIQRKQCPRCKNA